MHINFRDSKLTRILQPSLSGDARMAVICCATPSELYLEETRSTLQFASRAKLVKTNAQVNEVLDDRSIIRRLQRELAEARRQTSISGDPQHLEALENKAASAGTAAIEAKAKLDRLKNSILNAGYLISSCSVVDASQTTVALTPASTKNKSRKRRNSEGGLFSSPLGREIYRSSVPSTAPKRRKNLQQSQKRVLSPRSEVSIVREALSARANLENQPRGEVEKLSRDILTLTKYNEKKE